MNNALKGNAATTMKTLNTTGQDIQLCNGTTREAMYLSAYSPFSLPYTFKTSQSLGAAGLSKSNGPANFATRGVVLQKDALKFSILWGNLLVDSSPIDFKDTPDGVDYGVLANVNGVFETKPFSITSGSAVSFVETAGFVDTLAAASALRANGYVRYTVALVDNATNSIIGTLKEAAFRQPRSPIGSLHPVGCLSKSMIS